MKILVAPNAPFATANIFYAIDIFITDYGFDYQLREAIPKTQLAGQLKSDATPDPTSKHGLDNVVYTTGTIDVFGPITDRVQVKFDDFRTRSDFHDYAAYVLPITILDGVWDWAKNTSEIHPLIQKDQIINSNENKMFNATAATVSSKRHPYAEFHDKVGGRVIAVHVPLKNSPNSDWHIVVNAPHPDLLRVSPDTQEMISSNDINGPAFPHNPKVVFDTNAVNVSTDGTVDLPFHLRDPDTDTAITNVEADIYITSKGGRLNKLVVPTVNGRGVVKFIPEYLSTGDTIKVSCGFKYFSGTDDCLVTVV
jgi:hypothetical protein